MGIGSAIGAVVGAGASLLGASKNSKAISKSTDAQLAAQRESIEAQLQANRESLAVQTAAYNQSNALQSQAYNSSGQLQSSIYNNNTGMLNPYMQTGYAASDQINALLGLPEQGGYTPKAVSFSPIKATAITAPSTVTGATNPAAPPASPLPGGVAPATTATRPAVPVSPFGGITGAQYQNALLRGYTP